MIKNWLEINGKVFDVTVVSITESATVLYSDKTGRTISKGARMILDPIGTFYGHKVIVKRKQENIASYDNLFSYVTRPVYNGFKIKAVHNQETIQYDAYISSAERTVKHIDTNSKRVYWTEMELNIVPMEAQVIPN